MAEVDVEVNVNELDVEEVDVVDVVLQLEDMVALDGEVLDVKALDCRLSCNVTFWKRWLQANPKLKEQAAGWPHIVHALVGSIAEAQGLRASGQGHIVHALVEVTCEGLLVRGARGARRAVRV